MTRKTFAQILRDAKVDISVEYERIRHAIYRYLSSPLSFDPFCPSTVSGEIQAVFPKLRCSNTAVSLDDFNNELGFSFPEEIRRDDIDCLISFCEYWYNIFVSYIEFIEQNPSEKNIRRKANANQIDFKKEIETIQNKIERVSEKVSYMKVLDGDYYSFVEKSPAAISVAEVIEDQTLSLETLTYNHQSMKGDIAAKRAVLNKMAQYLEPKRQMLKSVNQTLERDLFQIFNRFNIRHNNIDPSDAGKFNQNCADMSEEELEALYDDTYQMWLLAVLELDNVERQKRLEKYRE